MNSYYTPPKLSCYTQFLLQNTYLSVIWQCFISLPCAPALTLIVCLRARDGDMLWICADVSPASTLCFLSNSIVCRNSKSSESYNVTKAVLYTLELKEIYDNRKFTVLKAFFVETKILVFYKPFLTTVRGNTV